MQREEEPEIATVGRKGQIVIHHELRMVLRITPKRKLAIYRRNDKLGITRLKILPMCEQLSELLRQSTRNHARERDRQSERS
jgi:bifunctional DNA-binding transcriptional regulator/antitoxin component of YhaV-PrlF toxin-antitoxin module